MERCKDTIEEKNGIAFGGLSYYPCDRTAKYTIFYIETKKGTHKSRNVCGIHFKSAQKTAKRLLEKYNYDCKFTFIELKDTI